MVKFLREKGLI